MPNGMIAKSIRIWHMRSLVEVKSDLHEAQCAVIELRFQSGRRGGTAQSQPSPAN